MPELLNELKAKGYKVVHMKAKASLTTLPQWDEAAKGEFKGATASDRPTSSVVRTIEEFERDNAPRGEEVSAAPGRSRDRPGASYHYQRMFKST